MGGMIKIRVYETGVQDIYCVSIESMFALMTLYLDGHGNVAQKVSPIGTPVDGIPMGIFEAVFNNAKDIYDYTKKV